MEQFEIVRALAYEDTSAAWGLFVGGSFAGLLGAKLPAAGREEVFADGVVPIAGVFNPGGAAATPVDGGYVAGLRGTGSMTFTMADWL